MKQSTDGFCISNLLMYFAQKAFELASMYHKERSKGTHVSKCKTPSTLRVFAFLKGNKAVILVIQIQVSPSFQSSTVLLENCLTSQSKGI